MAVFTARHYRNLQWALLPVNMIDTVSGVLTLDDEAAEPVPIHDEDITTFKTLLTSATVKNMPIALGDEQILTAYSWTLGTYLNSFGIRWTCTKYRKDAIVGYGSFIFDVDAPVKENIEVKITPEGYLKKRKVDTIDWDNDFEDISTDSLTRLKNKQPFDDFLEARLTTGNVTEGNLDDESIFDTDVKDHIGNKNSSAIQIIPIWASYDDSVYQGNNFKKGLFHFESGNLTGNGTALSATAFEKKAAIKYLGNLQYQIDWQFPIKQLIIGAVRRPTALLDLSGPMIKAIQCIDVVTKLHFDVYGFTQNDKKISFSYSVDHLGNLTENVLNTNPLKMPENELLTTSVTMSEQPWDKVIAKTLIDKYINGKYVVYLDVDAEWCLKNSITINAITQVQTLTGEFIKRNEVTCNFFVKAIEKIFDKNSFYYRIMLLEV